MRDVRSLLGTVRDLDSSYLEKWANSLSLNEWLEQARRMKDVSTAAERRFLDLMMSRSAEERMVMACRMFATVKVLIIAGLRTRGVTDPREVHRQVFLALYAQEHTPEQVERILARIDVRSSADLRTE